MPLWSLLGSPIARGVGIALVAACLAGGAYLAIDSRAVARCEAAHELADLRTSEAAHQAYMSAAARAERLSAELSKTQRRLNDVKTEYLSYAHGISGNCPAALGMLANAAASGASLPATAGPSTDPAAQIAAAAIGANIAENYARCLANEAQLSALIEWHAKR